MKTTRSSRRGYALMLVMLEMSLIAMLWGIAYRQSVATMLFLTQLAQPAAPATGSNDGYKSMARALSLLETGDPPDGGSGIYTCNATVYLASGPAYFTITYQKENSGSSGEIWTVRSIQQPSDSSGMTDWDTMPPTFGL